ncbi:hypothetical protein BLS_006144 [Venturia inaequalis]|uniref:Aminoglycoside phosphotransferase domain-containing protein n=1 Tax=Venturia inaequalis TaxID=5025 RepID=A0A8H3UD00_VENIN|nr:hypothetical protein BLS_006144 [Venturia inaequalis]
MEYLGDPWPVMPDGSEYDGKQLLTLVRDGRSPFRGAWEVNLLIREIEEKLDTKVVDIPMVYDGANYYGVHVKLSDRRDIIARLRKSDFNWPNYCSRPYHKVVPQVEFEAAVYDLLRNESDMETSSLLYHRVPEQRPEPRVEVPVDIVGRSLFLFKKDEGEKNIYIDLPATQRSHLLKQAARIRASLFNYALPLDFAETWFLTCLFEQKPEFWDLQVASTRKFCLELFTSKIEATICNIGDMIGWPSDNVVVGPIAFAAKKSLLDFIPTMLPSGSDELCYYRLVLEHGDYGIHNMSIQRPENGTIKISSLFDWETGSIVPALLSDPTFWVQAGGVGVDENGDAKLFDVSESATAEETKTRMAEAQEYTTKLFKDSPEYYRAVVAGKDARHLWFTLRAWRGDDPEKYFGALGAWAEARMKEMREESL